MSSLSELIRHDDPISYGATAVYPWKAMIERKYKFESRFGEEVPLYRTEGKTIHLPRALCPVGPNDLRTKGEPVKYLKTPVPRPIQVDVFAETKDFLMKGQSGVVCAYTGWGKTVLGYFAAAVLGVKTLIITTKDDIYQQWIDGACGRVSKKNPEGINFLGLKEHEVGEIRGDKCEIVGTKFCVAMIQSLSKDGKYPENVLKLMQNQFGLVIFDECHRLPADQFSEVADMFPSFWRLGLSATPERSDGKELLVTAHIGPIRAKTQAEELVPKVLRFHSGWQCPKVFRMDPKTHEKRVVKIPHEPGKTAHIEKIIAADPERNDQLVDLINTAFQKGRQTVFFTNFHDHIHTIQRALTKIGISGKEIGIYIGAQTKAEQAARDKATVKPILLTTFMMMGEGTNLPWYDTAVLGMPRANVKQPVGRIRRHYPDKQFPAVMDVIDGDSPVFAGYAASRLKWYNSIGCDVKDMG